jgi:LmbE family N-acetylglucosaminyl deacetylase
VSDGGASPAQRELMAWFAGDAGAGGPRAVILVAHPDDETVGAGGRLAALDPAAVVVVTDGAPRDGFFARSAGCADRTAYAALRRRELEAALRMAAVPQRRLRQWQFVDQEAALDLEALARAVRAACEELRPEVVLTHPYEGGHPDHDAVAFAAAAAVRLLPVPARPILLEMAFYHRGPHGPVWGRFAGDPGRPVSLGGEALARKRAMLACYPSQGQVLAHVPLDAERIRPAAEYDFSAVPPPGVFDYDGFGWPVRGADFRERAAVAWRRLGLGR